MSQWLHCVLIFKSADLILVECAYTTSHGQVDYIYNGSVSLFSHSYDNCDLKPSDIK